MPSEEKINRFKGLRSTNAEHLLEENQLSDMNNMRTDTGALIKRKGFGDTKLLLHLDGRYYWPFILDPWRPPWGEDPEEPGGPVVWRRPPEDPDGDPPPPWPPRDPDGPPDPPLLDPWVEDEDPDNPNGLDETYAVNIPKSIVAYTPFLQTVLSSDVAYAGALATHADQILNEADRQLGFKENEFETLAAAVPPIQAGWSLGLWSNTLYIRDYDLDYTHADVGFALGLVLQSTDRASLEMPAFTVEMPDDIISHTSFEITISCIGQRTGVAVTDYDGDTAKLTFYDNSTGLYLTNQTANTTLATGLPIDITDPANWTNGVCILDIKVNDCDIDGFNVRGVMEINTLGALQYFDTSAATGHFNCTTTSIEYSECDTPATKIYVDPVILSDLFPPPDVVAIASICYSTPLASATAIDVSSIDSEPANCEAEACNPCADLSELSYFFYEISGYSDTFFSVCGDCDTKTPDACQTFDGIFRQDACFSGACSLSPRSGASIKMVIDGYELDSTDTKLEIVDGDWFLTVSCASGAVDVWHGKKDTSSVEPTGTYTRISGCDTTATITIAAKTDWIYANMASDIVCAPSSDDEACFSECDCLNLAVNDGIHTVVVRAGHKVCVCQHCFTTGPFTGNRCNGNSGTCSGGGVTQHFDNTGSSVDACFGVSVSGMSALQILV